MSDIKVGLFSKKPKVSPESLAKLRELLQFWRTGGVVDGLEKPSIEDFYTLTNISNLITTTTSSENIKHILDYCDIPYKTNGNNITFSV